jgi:hypothetical protein
MKNIITTCRSITPSHAEQHASRVMFMVKAWFVTILAIFILVLKGNCADSTLINAKNAVYLQAAGIGNRQSVNVDRIFRQSRIMNYSFSAGVSAGNKRFSLPVGLHAFTTGKQHHLEMSLYLIHYFEKHPMNKTVDLDKQLYIKPLIGYRYQKLHSGFFLKAGVGPQIFMDPPSSDFWAFTPKIIAPSAQLALGISF